MDATDDGQRHDGVDDAAFRGWVSERVRKADVLRARGREAGTTDNVSDADYAYVLANEPQPRGAVTALEEIVGKLAAMVREPVEPVRALLQEWADLRLIDLSELVTAIDDGGSWSPNPVTFDEIEAADLWNWDLAKDWGSKGDTLPEWTIALGLGLTRAWDEAEWLLENWYIYHHEKYEWDRRQANPGRRSAPMPAPHITVVNLRDMA